MEMMSYLYSGDKAITCSDLPMSQLRGVAFLDSVLIMREQGGTFYPPKDYVAESMRHIKMYDMNLIRVPMYWESYANNSAAFLNEIDVIARAAARHNICVVFDNHHWYTTSYWGIKKFGYAEGGGFPSFAVKDFGVIESDNIYASTAAPFWAAFLKNEISIDGKKIWDAQSEFLKSVIKRADIYKNVIGYEILNEPHLYDPSQYEDLGKYHTYMAQEIREISSKRIFFDRETSWGFQRIPSLEHEIVPRNVSGIVYTPQLYSAPLAGTPGENQIANFKQLSVEFGIEVLIGEWSASTQEESDAYLKTFEENGFGWTYYSWRPTESPGLGVTVYDTIWTPMTDGLRQVMHSMQKT